MDKDYRFIPHLYKKNTLYNPQNTSGQIAEEKTVDEPEIPIDNDEISQSVAIVVHYVDAIPTQDKELLMKILGAVNLGEPDVYIARNTGHNSLKEVFSSAKNLRQIVFFGVRPAEAGLQGVDVPKYQMGTVKNLTILTADPLPEIATSKEKKKALWLNLQRMFGVS